MIQIGRKQTLRVLRTVPMGLILGEEDDSDPPADEERGGEDPAFDRSILLPTRYVPKGAAPGESIEVFVYTDSEDRPIATTEEPRAEVDSFAGLRVVSVGRLGAFLDWGLPKDLLLPFRSQWSPVRVGETVVVRVLFDERSGRPVASSKVERFLAPPPRGLRPGRSVEMLAYHETDLGCKAIVDGAYSGLLYRENGVAPLRVGERAQGYLARIRPDGRVDLSRRPAGPAGLDDARQVLEEALDEAGGRLELTDESSPAEIRALLGLSKKAFKRAVGALYRERRIRLEEDAIERVDPVARPASAEASKADAGSAPNADRSTK